MLLTIYNRCLIKHDLGPVFGANARLIGETCVGNNTELWVRIIIGWDLTKLKFKHIKTADVGKYGGVLCFSPTALAFYPFQR